MRFIDRIKANTILTIESDNYQSTNFHEAFSFVIIFGQFFGIMPVDGIRSNNIHLIRFKWRSLKFICSIYNIIGAFVMAIFCILKFALDGFRLDKTGTMSFYIMNFFGALQFIQIAKNWSIILKEWVFVELSMRHYGNAINLRRRFKILTITIMSLAFVEHLLFVLNALFTGKMCENFSKYPADIYFGVAFPSVFTTITYSAWKAVLVEIANILSTVTWNFTDLFIILISSALALRFRQVVKRLETQQFNNERFWREIREDHNKLSHLTQTIDKYLAPLVMISFINNTFFICVQLYNSLKERVGVVETVYYFYSFGFLLGRTVAVTLYGAWINDESRRPLRILHSVSTRHYCTEISRLIQQINTSPVGITGCRFFLITRGFLLQMASTIVTFELMFLQFDPLIRAESQVTRFNVTYRCIK